MRNFGNRRLGNCLRDERGVALPVTIAVLFAMLALALAAASTAITSNSEARRDRGVKQALEAADAGVDIATYRINQIQPLPGQCPQISGGVPVSSTSPWCDPQTVTLDDGESDTYQVSTEYGNPSRYVRTIVSTGKATIAPGQPQVTRRVIATVRATPNPALQSNKDVLINGDAIVDERSSISCPPWGGTDPNDPTHYCGAVVRAGGKLNIEGRAFVCSYAYMNAGTIYQNRSSTLASGPRSGCLPQSPAGGTIGSYPNVNRGSVSPVPPVKVPPNIATNNDDCVLDWLVNHDGSCPQPGPPPTLHASTIWDPVHHLLMVKSGDRLSLPAGNYFFCYLELNGAGGTTLSFGSGSSQPSNIYIGDPTDSSQCLFTPAVPLPAGAHGTGWGSVHVGSSGTFVNAAAPAGDPTNLQLRVIGSRVSPTSAAGANDTVNFGGGGVGTMSMIVTAPYSSVTLQGDTNTFVSAIRADQVALGGNDGVRWDDRAANVDLTYTRTNWSECPASDAPAATPSTGC